MMFPLLVAILILSLLSTMLVSPLLLLSRMVVVTARTALAWVLLEVLARTLRLAP